MAEPEENEKMEALKTAYAEMILNTAKEAAARVMASELKSRRLEQELILNKEEAARMLIRLKQMIDAKTKVAEVTLLSQQKKVEELECQLNEAEGIIIDLRAELSQAQGQLEEAKNKTLNPSRRNENAQMCYMTSNGKASEYELFNTSLGSGPELIVVDANGCDVAKKRAELDSEYRIYSINDHQNLNPIKEPDLFRNGCTQRIRATETSLENENLLLADQQDSSGDSANFGNMNPVGNTSVSVENGQHVKNESVRRSIRKRKLKRWDEVIGACTHPFKKVRRVISSLSCCKTNKDKHSVEFDDPLKIEVETQIQKKLDCAPKYPDGERGHAEALPEDVKLINVLVKPDEHNSMFGLNSSAKIDCDVKHATATEATNICHDKHKRVFKYTFSRKRKKGSIIYPERKSSFGENSSRKSLRRKQNAISGLSSSRLLTKSSMDSRKLAQVARQLISLSKRGGNS